MKELAFERWLFGYRWLHILLKREGCELNEMKLYRLYREEVSTVRKLRRTQARYRHKSPNGDPQEPSQRLSYDFMSDSLAHGRRVHILSIIDC